MLQGATVQTEAVMNSIPEKEDWRLLKSRYGRELRRVFGAHYGEKIPLLRSFSDLCTEIIFPV